MKILSIKVKREVDDSPDTSYLGEYKNTWQDGAIDRVAQGDHGRHEYKYFVPAMTGEETGNPDSPMQDYKRMEALNRGDWCYLGIFAVAEVQTGKDSVIQTIRSGGLWGIESDSEASYFTEVEDEQLAELTTELRAIGFSARAIKKAIANVKRD